jgi:sterol desaturase/sphingolipid hydroxylase (fatty acid hydroxylase superfamily)
MNYDWTAALVYFGTLVGLTTLGRFLVFKVPDLQRTREINAAADEPKMARKSFREWVTINGRFGLGLNVLFYFAALPFCVSLESLPFWRHLVDIILILLIFDFMYYLTHRFLFHGKLLRKVHALHHQARTPTYIDALYVHPIETVIGLGLFLVSIPIVAFISGAPLNAFSAAVATLIFTQVNTLNHVYTNLPRFPFKTIDYITGVHRAHHIDMNQGNFATLTMIYDWMFGTYEKPVHRQTA